MTPDTGNSLFELVGAFMAWRNALQLWRDREVKGVYWPIYYFYTAWGVWNLYYYPSLGQWGSTAAGVVLCAGNAVWIVLASRIALERRRYVAECVRWAHEDVGVRDISPDECVTLREAFHTENHTAEVERQLDEVADAIAKYAGGPE